MPYLMNQYLQLLWGGLLWQTRLDLSSLQALGTVAELVAALGTLAGLTVGVYRLGVWRQEMNEVKRNVGVEVVRYREEVTRNFRLIDQRMGSIERVLDRLIHDITERRVSAERWQASVDAALAGTFMRVEKLEGRLEEEAA